jgi:hypothetical protein
MQPWSFTVPDYRDGKRFLVKRNVKPEHIAPLTVLLNAAKSNSFP